MAGASLLAASQAEAVTVVATFDPSITSAPNAAQIENAINKVDSFYSVFTNPVTVNIYFKLDAIPGDLGTSSPVLERYTYGQYTALLTSASQAQHGNQVLATAVANLAYGNTPATTGLGFVRTTSASGRALGDATDLGVMGADGVIGDGNFDGIVRITNDPGLVSWGAVGPNQYSAITTAFHEVDEVLGIGGPGSTEGRNRPAMGQLDLYRYDWFSGLPSYSAAPDPNAVDYLSVDGGWTALQVFNADPAGDSGDWAGWFPSGFYCSPENVQDGFGCSGDQAVNLGYGSIEVTALQSIGYNLSVPEPATWMLVILGLGMAGAAVRRRGQMAAA
jgi:hypothetical protein